ncbi:MAG: hypothetical protein WDZ41_01070 [Candidatus Babeliales bacterium]
MLRKLAFIALVTMSTSTYSLQWQDAKTKIIAKANHITKAYKKEECPIVMEICSIILSCDEECWKIVEQVVKEIETLPVYKLAQAKPYDDCFWSELLYQGNMIAGQKASTFELGARLGIIIGLYVDTLKESLRK